VKIRLATFMSSALILLFVVLALTGCAVPIHDSAYEWKHSGAKAIPMELHLTSQENVQALCCATDAHVMACAWRDEAANRCDVFTAYTKLPDETLQHEKRHCDGWTHQVFGSPGSAEQKICKTPAQVLSR